MKKVFLISIIAFLLLYAMIFVFKNARAQTGCTLTSAVWSAQNATEGMQVNLNATGTGTCDGQTVSFEVRENDSVTEGIGDDPVNTNPASVTFSGNNATGVWTAEWQNDCNGLCNPPEYFFTATIGSQTLRSADPLLTVTKPAGGGTGEVTIPSDTDWFTLGGNYQRTSWVNNDPQNNVTEVRGNLNVEWYQPIEPYIPYKVQPIFANDTAYISTSKGLYAFDLNSTFTQTKVKWVYPTELPLGHSPTVVTVNNRLTAYVGGYDRKIHAINADTGQPIPGYTPYEAEAGFETNPLVIDVNGTPTIYAGNRDGKFYALNAVTGEKIWEFPTGGPILYSAAYSTKQNAVFFASNDMYAYALNALDGSLIWKSQKFPGAGFHPQWTVVYTEKQTQRDYVIFGGGDNNRDSDHTQEHALEGRYLLPTCFPQDGQNPTCNWGDLAYPTLTAPADDTFWTPNTQLFDASNALTYFETYPHRRTSFILEADTGQEYTFDHNGNGQPTYNPFTLTNITQSGNRYPPIVGVDGILYSNNTYVGAPWIVRGGLVGWKFGTPFISRVHNRDIAYASDEPLAFSSAGKLVYFSLNGDRTAGAFDITIPYGQPNRSWSYYDEGGNSLILRRAPDYQTVYNDGVEAHFHDIGGWQVYTGKDQSKNGVYGKHGTGQSPPIPYQGKVYMLRGNTLLAWIPGTTNPSKLSLAEIAPVSQPVSIPTNDQIKQRLEVEIQKILSAEPLRPGYHSSALYDQFIRAGGYNQTAGIGELLDYFQNPADTVYTLLLAYPYLSPTTQDQVKTYLQTNYGPGSKYDFTRIVHVGWSGAGRESFDIPPENFAVFGTQYRSPLDPSVRPLCYGCAYWRYFPPFSFYAAFKYAQVVGDSNQAIAADILSRMDKTDYYPYANKFEAPPSDVYLQDRPYILNQYIAGYFGYLELQKMAGLAPSSTVQATYEHLLNLRSTTFDKDVPLAWQGRSYPANAVDNNAQTYWISAMGGNQWLSVDLGTTTSLGAVRIVWGPSFSNNYNIEVSDDGATWSAISTGNNGNLDNDFGGTNSGRYLRVRTISGVNPAYYQLASLEVYASGGGTDVAYGKTATASTTQSNGGGTTAFNYNNVLAVARNFMFMTPELGDYLNKNVLTKVQEAVNEYQYIAPYWFVSKYDATTGEGTLHHLYDSPALFQAKAYILKQPYSELAKYLDVPAFERGDLFYIQNLTAALDASGTVGSTPAPSATPTPNPCTINSVSWPQGVTSVTEGTDVNISVTASGSCANQTVHLATRKNVTLQPDVDAATQPQPQDVALIFNSNTNTATASAVWKADAWTDACTIGTCDPTYFTKGQLINSDGTYSSTEVTTDRNNDLTVTQAQIVDTPALTDWPQVGNGPEHTGYSNETLGTNFQVAWTHPFQPDKVYPQVQAITYQGKVYVGTEGANGMIASVYAFDAKTGTEAWKYEVGSSVLGSVAAANNLIFFAALDGNVYALNSADGALVWRTQLTAKKGFSVAPILDSRDNPSRILLGGRDGIFYALDLQGNKLWEYNVGSPIYQTAAYSNGKVFFGAMDMHVYSLNVTDGSLAWKSSKLTGMAIKDFWPVIYQGKVFVRPMVGGGYGPGIPFSWYGGARVPGTTMTDWEWLTQWSSTVAAGNAMQVPEIVNSQNNLEDRYNANPSTFKKDLYTFDENTGQEIGFFGPDFNSQTHSGTAGPFCVDRDGLMIVPLYFVTSGWGRLDLTSRRITDILYDGLAYNGQPVSSTTGYPRGMGNDDENLQVTCSKNLILSFHWMESNANYTGAFDLDNRRWTLIGAGHRNRQMSSNTQGGSGNPASISNGMIYHISWHELIARTTN